MRRNVFVVLLLALATLVRIDSPAHAGEPTGVIVTGEPSLESRMREHLESWLRANGREVMATPLSPAAIRALADCFTRSDEGCARAVVERDSRAATIVYARIDTAPGASGARDISLTAYLFQKDRDAIADRRICERCSDDGLAGAAAELMRSLDRSSGATGSLRVTSTPVGAQVVVDGTKVGITPLDHTLAPGDHEVALVLDRHDIETRTVAVRANETTTLDLALSPRREPSRSRALPAALVLGGAAVLTTGVVLFAIDEDPSPTGPPQIRDSAPAGVVLAATGAVALTAGIWLWRRARSTSTDAPTATSARARTPARDHGHPIAALSRDAGLIGWATAF